MIVFQAIAINTHQMRVSYGDSAGHTRGHNALLCSRIYGYQDVSGGNVNAERGVIIMLNGLIQTRQMQTVGFVRELLCLRDDALELSNKVVFAYVKNWSK
jgi:hypothetical protein